MVSTSEIERASARAGSAIWCAWMAAVPAGMILYDRRAGGSADHWSGGCRGWRAAGLVAAARWCVVALVGWMAVIAIWTGGHWAPLPWTVQFANPGWPSEAFRWITGSITAALTILAFASAALSVAQMLRRSQIPQVRVSVPGAKLILAPVRFANFLAPFAAAGFAMMFVSVAAWGFEASRKAAFHERLGPLGLTSAVSWLLSTTLFAFAAIVSIRSARSLLQT